MKPRVATVWLGGCSGCHMSFLDLDERLLELADRMELVYSPIADIKAFPAGVDVTLIRGELAGRALGDALKAHWAGWRCYFFTGDPALPKGVRLKASKRTPLFNGAIECRLFEYQMIAGSARKPKPADKAAD